MGLRLFLDTNIIIYFLEKNEKFYSNVIKYFEKAEVDEIELITSTLSFKKLEYDLYYIKNRGLPLDMLVLFKTIVKVGNISYLIYEITAIPIKE